MLFTCMGLVFRATRSARLDHAHPHSIRAASAEGSLEAKFLIAKETAMPTQIATSTKNPAMVKRPIKRAITLGGGGPAAGLHIGILEAFEDYAPEMAFDVWSLSCIGAWVGIVYNQCEGPKRVEQTYDFFKTHVFRDDESYSRFPINSVFGTNWFGNTEALWKFISDPSSYHDLWLPHRMAQSFAETVSMFTDAKNKWDLGD